MKFRERFKRLTFWNKKGVLGSSALVISILLAIFLWINPQNSENSHAEASTPDIALSFHHPESPQFRIQNISDAIVQESKYKFLIYDLDQPGTNQPFLNLHIPVKTIDDYIRPESSLGPWSILSLSKRGATVEPGNRLFGFGQVQCPNCESFRHYWLFFEVGNSGWFSEVDEATHQSIMGNLSTVIHGQSHLMKLIESVIPRKSRVPI